ncbi:MULTISPECIES: DUF5677 domain-containing protein [unclassified Streptomyces]|uniref:DUF5677 domain-containing protein n=1 Tax=unclassified Streptomyces TaxID=2593676 RepID=UPI001E57D1DD|nr:DUF5677 domain-containing protein [Streptomyces sp. CB02980]MCB8906740.1 DUF5677 domain-containing protein [Streptomyces sp. CB02980]
MSAGDEKTAAELTAALLTIKELADAFDEVAAREVSVRAEHELTFLAAFGWWGKIARTARGVTLLADAGLSSEATPLARVVVEHTLALKWLLDGAPETVLAWEEEGQENQLQLIEEAAKAEWTLPDWVSKPELPAKGDEHPLRNEYSSFLRLTQLYGEQDTYVAYRLMSADVHPSSTGSSRFRHEEDDKISLRMPDDDHAPLTHVAYCLIQASKMTDELLAGSPLAPSILRAEVLFGRPPHMPERIPEKETPVQKAPTRVQVSADDLDEAKALAAIVLDSLRHAGAKLGQESVSQRKRRVMVDVSSMPTH